MPKNHKINFKIKYLTLDSNKIFNMCGPESIGPHGWDEGTMKKRKERAQKYIESLNRKNGFYDNLEKSILEKGIRNPILVSAGWCAHRLHRRMPIYMQNDVNSVLVCDRHGGSRLYIAQKYDMDIPCIVSDHVNMFSDIPTIETVEELYELYENRPSNILINVHGVHVSGLPHIHLGR